MELEFGRDRVDRSRKGKDMVLQVGDRVYGATKDIEYQITAPCGAGSFGIVYRIVDANGKAFALKTITTELDDQALKALQNEGARATEVIHENAIRVYYLHDGTKYPEFPPYMIMEYADGGTLQKSLDERRSSNQLFSNDELRLIFCSLCLGMKAINEKLVHRDIKPDNILIVNGVLKISDFGLSKVVDQATRSSTLKGINHPKYCAPEAWQGQKNTPAMDMYSMGIVFYEIATLRHPFNPKREGDVFDAWRWAHLVSIPENPRTWNTDLDDGLDQLIVKMMEKRPERRYPSWDAIIEKLRSEQVESIHEPDITALVNKAMASHLKTEAARVHAEETEKRLREHIALIEHCFKDIVKAAQTIVDSFNQRSEFARLSIRHLSKLAFSIETTLEGVAIAVGLPHEKHRFRGGTIKAWGHTQAPSGKGFNLLLIEEAENDPYGKWIAVHVKHHPLFRSSDKRPEPFYFEDTELPEELYKSSGMHIYTADVEDFEAKMLIPLVEEIL